MCGDGIETNQGTRRIRENQRSEPAFRLEEKYTEIIPIEKTIERSCANVEIVGIEVIELVSIEPI